MRQKYYYFKNDCLTTDYRQVPIRYYSKIPSIKEAYVRNSKQLQDIYLIISPPKHANETRFTGNDDYYFQFIFPCCGTVYSKSSDYFPYCPICARYDVERKDAHIYVTISFPPYILENTFE